MAYTLYNKYLDKKLTHPKYGIWFASNINDAKEMLKACHEYLTASNIPETEFDNFVIIDVETGKEINANEQ